MGQAQEKVLAFTPKLDIGSFASLVNSKIVVPSTTSNYFAVEKFFLVDLLNPVIRRVHLDERWYLSRNPDVKEAIARGVVADARDHYRRHGYFEGRMPYRIDVDAAWYERTYPDVRDGIRRQDFVSAQEHFEMVGYAEGRLPFPGFNLETRDD
jgi:hypothetical protein